MIRITTTLSYNDVMAISENLRKIGIGGITVKKVRGRGKTPPPEIHSGKGRAVFQPQFSEKYVVEVIISKKKEDEAVEIIKKNSRRGKIMIEPILRVIDIATGIEGETVI